MKRWGLLGVERTKTFVGAAGLLEGDRVLDDLQDVGVCLEVLDEMLGKATHPF